jgi:hypothetical protein
MLKREDERWLGEAYPGLVYDGEAIAGDITFAATYNSEHNRFLILKEGVADLVGGLALSGCFRVRITGRSDKSISVLPALYVEDLEAIDSRHFSQIDKSACLCSPLEEDEFLKPDLQFIPFLEQLVIPFLYGQVFYSRNRCWPWAEYAHGAAGLLEAYGDATEGASAADLLRRLAQDRRAWPRIRTALQQKPYVKGHTLCFCPTPDQIRRCHPRALRGVLRLQRDVRAQAIPILPAA